MAARVSSSVASRTNVSTDARSLSPRLIASGPASTRNNRDGQPVGQNPPIRRALSGSRA